MERPKDRVGACAYPTIRHQPCFSLSICGGQSPRRQVRPFVSLWSTKLQHLNLRALRRRRSPRRSAPLDEAFKQCDSPRGARVTDEGETLIIRTTGDDTDVRASFADVTCILRELEAPSRTLHRMETTRSLDGRVTDSWDDYTAEWTYHPDDGLNVIIFVTQDK